MKPWAPSTASACQGGCNVLLDRCLTGSLPFACAAHTSFTNQWPMATLLFDRCLTGGKAGCQINVNRVFFQYQPPRPLHEIDAELAEVEKRILDLLREVTQ